MTRPTFLANPPRHLFFTGKGGVGKTSIAAATAVALAGDGQRVLLVSTDPASNIGQLFDQQIGNRITPIDGLTGLDALEIDPDEAVAQYRARILDPLRGVVPDDEFAAVQESISGACTTEIASFNEFTELLTSVRIGDRYDHIVFDTAPTGHTIRLLSLPGAWTAFLERGQGNASCLGPLAGLDRQKQVYADAVDSLRDAERTRLVLVSRANRLSLTEAARTSGELAEIGLTNQRLVINGVLASESDDPLALAMRQREAAAIASMPADLAALPRDVIPLKPHPIMGRDALASFFADDRVHAVEEGDIAIDAPPLATLVDELAGKDHGLVMLLGKGGVGKTTMAAAVAMGLVDRGKTVLLTTTDPAAHLAETLHGEVDGLTVERIDPEKELAAYTAQVLRSRGRGMAADELALLEEDLKSPCYEEIAVFQAFSKAIRLAQKQFVVVDTAPTGHTLLLMDATGAYHHEVVRSMGDSAHFSTPLMRLQDADLTHVIVVTLAEPTPVLEAQVLTEDLARAGITPWSWVVNMSLAAARVIDPLLRARALNEVPLVEQVTGNLAQRSAVVPMLEEEPVGPDAIRALVGGAVVAHRQP